MVARCAAAPVCDFRPQWQPLKSPENGSWDKTPAGIDGERYSNLIYLALVRLFGEQPSLVMIGEDIEGPYGGAFKVTRDLSQRFPGRIRNTPISEAAVTGMGAGAALAGLRPIIEIMFGDFLSLTFDQLIQHACKFAMMYGGKAKVPLIIRTPMGGRRGYGPTHSQSIESHFLGMPELDVFALNGRVDPERVYRPLVLSGCRPSLVLENKILYTRPLRREWPLGFEVFLSDEEFPTVRLSPINAVPRVTVVCYGGMLEVVEEAVPLAFQQDEVLVEVICPTQLVPLNLVPIVESVRRTGRILVAEEGKTFAAFGSEILAGLLEAGVDCRARRIGYDHFIPSSFSAEMRLLPSAEDVRRAIADLAHD
jgi:2-oxoisovalerate dehydrogenase E1 component